MPSFTVFGAQIFVAVVAATFSALVLIGAALLSTTPLKHVIVLIQDPWLGFGWNNGELLIVLAILLAAAVASARWLRWE